MKSCHNEENSKLKGAKVLLMGNPNVGKSVFFSRYTGLNVISSNYSGTTVTYSQGSMCYKGKNAVLIDVPGTYSLDATSSAERVADEFLEKGADAILFVLDASNLERNLYLLGQVLEKNIPTVVALNLMDMAKRRGIDIDVNKLEEKLNIKVIPTVATTGEGMDEVLNYIFLALGENDSRFLSSSYDKMALAKDNLDADERYKIAEKIAESCLKKGDSKQGKLEKLDRWTITPWPGLPIALLILSLAFGTVIGGGKALRAVFFLPLIEDIWTPFIEGLMSNILSEGFLLNVLTGEYGVLVKGLEWPFALVLPYVLLFYAVLSLLEDSGYLPRLGILVDGLLRKIGLQGGSVVPMFLGYGCAVPAILGTRARDSNKERIIIATMVSIAVPCVSQTGAFISLLGDRSWLAVISLFALSFAAMIIAGIIMNKYVKGEEFPTLAEIPPLLIPNRTAFFKKLWMRVKHFLLEAEIPMILAVGIAALLLETGSMEYIGKAVEPLVVGFLGMPEEASMALIFGIVRKELAVLPLVEMDLTTLQLIVGSTVALFYLPCISVFGVLSKEFGVRTAVKLGFLTVFLAFMTGGFIYQSSRLLMIFVSG